MKDFDVRIPTRIIFGKGKEREVGRLIKEYGYQKVLLHYGGGSAVRSGLLDQVKLSLEEVGISYVELGGVQANPTLSLVREGIRSCLAEKADLILAVGGGSVIDSAKAIGDGAGDPQADVWDFFLQKASPKAHIPVAVILTLSASGSEMSQSAVLTNEETGLKRGFNSPTHQPLFSICNPELTYSVSRFQTGCGTVDIMMHTLERYFGWTKDSAVTDRLAEGLLRAVIEAGQVADKKPRDYEARATLMWAGSLSHNGLTGIGRDFFMQVHQLEHELSGMYPRIAHGAGLSALFASWARFVCPSWPERFAQYASRVWDAAADPADPMPAALEGIRRTEALFKSLGMPISLKELDVDPERFEEMAIKCTNFGARTLKGIRELKKAEMIQIYEMAYEAGQS